MSADRRAALAALAFVAWSVLITVLFAAQGHDHLLHRLAARWQTL